MARPRDAVFCCSSACKREIQPWEKGLAITMFARTLGMGKQRTSKSERLFLCPQCALRISLEKEPTAAAPVDRAFFHVLLDLSGSDQMDVVIAAGEQLQKRREQILYPHALPPAEILVPAKTLKSAG